MNPWSGIGKALVLTGLVIVAIGIWLIVMPKVPWLGKLPGDIAVKKNHFHFYFPVTTCIIVSIILSILFYLFRR